MEEGRAEPLFHPGCEGGWKLHPLEWEIEELYQPAPGNWGDRRCSTGWIEVDDSSPFLCDSLLQQVALCAKPAEHLAGLVDSSQMGKKKGQDLAIPLREVSPLSVENQEEIVISGLHWKPKKYLIFNFSFPIKFIIDLQPMILGSGQKVRELVNVPVLKMRGLVDEGVLTAVSGEGGDSFEVRWIV